MNYGPRIAKNGLILALDAADRNSYIGTGASWRDISGSNYTGTLSGNFVFDGANCGVINFDGSNAYASILNSSGINFTNSSGTISIWLRTVAAPPSGSYLISKNMDSTGGWGITIGSNGIPYFETKNNASGATSFYRFANQALNDGRWHNFVAVFTTSTTILANNTVSLYIDGVLSDGALTRSLVYGGNTAGNVEIARRTSGNYYSGYISNVIIYNRALTATEILFNYNNISFRYKTFIAYDWFAIYVLIYIRANGTVGNTSIPNLVSGGGNINASGVGSITNVQSKWGGTSFRIDSGSNGVALPSMSSIGTGDFTIECWYYASTLRSDIRFISGGATNGIGFGSRITSGRTIGMVKEGVSWVSEQTWTGVLLNQWVHMAACKIGSNIRYFQNGVQIGNTVTFSESFSSTTGPALAGVNNTLSPTYYNDVRITKVGLYSGNFTPPTAQFNLPY